MRWLVFCLALVACDDDTVVPVPGLDLSVPEDLGPPLDLTTHDFAPRPFDMTTCSYPPDAFGGLPDAAGFCDGTALAGTCAQTFFAKLATCFHPAGCCQATGSNEIYRSWQSGAQYFYGGQQWAFRQGGALCAESVYNNTNHWFGGDGSELPNFDPNLGTLTCPDGTQLNVGPFGGCDALNALLHQFQCSADPSCCVPYPVPY